MDKSHKVSGADSGELQFVRTLMHTFQEKRMNHKKEIILNK